MWRTSFMHRGSVCVGFVFIANLAMFNLLIARACQMYDCVQREEYCDANQVVNVGHGVLFSLPFAYLDLLADLPDGNEEYKDPLNRTVTYLVNCTCSGTCSQSGWQPASVTQNCSVLGDIDWYVCFFWA